MSDIVPLRTIRPHIASRLLNAQPGDLMPIDGHRDHRVVEWSHDTMEGRLRIHVRCTCGQLLGGQMQAADPLTGQPLDD